MHGKKNYSTSLWYRYQFPIFYCYLQLMKIALLYYYPTREKIHNYLLVPAHLVLQQCLYFCKMKSISNIEKRDWNNCIAIFLSFLVKEIIWPTLKEFWKILFFKYMFSYLDNNNKLVFYRTYTKKEIAKRYKVIEPFIYILLHMYIQI